MRWKRTQLSTSDITAAPLPNERRPDRADYLRRLGLDTDADAMEELAVSGGLRHTDNFQVFPPLTADSYAGRFTYRCMAHGLRRRNRDFIQRTEFLEAGDALVLSPPQDIPTATLAIMVCTEAGHHIGWLPGYLVDDLHQNGDWLITDAKATVAQVNPGAPLSHRLLIDFTGKLPPGFRMEDLPQYRPLALPDAYPTNKSSGKKADTV